MPETPPINQEFIDQVKRDIARPLSEWRATNLYTVNDNHPLVAMTREVTDKMHMKPIPVILHNGTGDGAAFYFDHDIMLLSPRIRTLLTPLEVKAVICHEMGHRQQTRLRSKVQEALDDSKAQPDANDTKRQRGKIFQTFEIFQELDADKVAAKYYGAETMLSAFKKILVHQNMDVLNRMSFFPELSYDALKALSRQDITKRVDEVARGDVWLQNEEIISMRFAQLRQLRSRGRG